MPVTPFHFGPGATIHALAPQYVSFLSFCAANVLMDVEPLYYMLTNQYPLHRFFHTYVGASLITAATVGLFWVVRQLASPLSLPNFFQWQSLKLRAVVLGAAAGAYSHIVLDSVMHSDMTPFAPFGNANPFLRAVPLGTLHWFCVGAGFLGAGILWMRRAAGGLSRS